MGAPWALATSTSCASHLAGDRQDWHYCPFLDRKTEVADSTSHSLVTELPPGCHLQPTAAHSLLPAPPARMVFKNADQTGPDHTSNLPLLSATFTPPPKQSDVKSGSASLYSHKQPPLRDTPHSFPHLPAAPRLLREQAWAFDRAGAPLQYGTSHRTVCPLQSAASPLTKARRPAQASPRRPGAPCQTGFQNSSFSALSRYCFCPAWLPSTHFTEGPPYQARRDMA